MLSFARGFAPCNPVAEPARHWLSGRLPHSRTRVGSGTAYRAASGTGNLPKCPCRPGAVQGCRGRSPRQTQLKNSPFPGGEGGRGDGGRRFSVNAGRTGGAENAPHLNTYNSSRFPSWSEARRTALRPPSHAPCRARRARRRAFPQHDRKVR